MNAVADRPLAVTMGEPAGIGGEITLKAWRLRRSDAVPFFVIDSPQRLDALAKSLGWDIRVETVSAAKDAISTFRRALPVLPVQSPCLAKPGAPDPTNSAAVLESIERAVDLVRTGQASALVTNPINKNVLMQAGFKHPGHTDYLAELADVPGRAVMMLVVPGLRVVPVTVHIPLRKVAESLTTEAILSCAMVTDNALRRDFGVKAPRLAIAALNPHAGENGALGTEEATVIRPAIDGLRSAGIEVAGPSPADSLFHREARRRYDAVICMYHDQALIPLKTVDFHNGVNVTLGLPFVRTSPDHGTAFDIAGTGRADARSLVAALGLAAELAATRAAADIAA
jgi:4-hydroxythreonine-4-phosphate dehydrogenase